MKKDFLVVLIVLLTAACGKEAGTEEPEQPRTPDIPEQVEADLLEITSHDWAKLADTVTYYYDNLLSKGRIKGYGPDSVWYELAVRETDETVFADFIVADSVWFNSQGSLNTATLYFNAYSTDIVLRKERSDSLSVSANDIKITAPAGFGVLGDKTSTLYYQGNSVGYVDIREFEDTDYKTGIYLVVHYWDDTRTFSFYDNGYIWLTDKLNELQ